MTIEKKDLQPESLERLKKPATGEKQILDSTTGLYIRPGVPVENISVPEPQIKIPDEPHVFVVDEMHVTDKNHRGLILSDVPVMFAHGHRIGKVWQFANGQSVTETVKAWGVYAKINNLPQIEFVIACNEENQPNPMGIKIKDFETGKLIAQAVGNTLNLGIAKIDRGGRVIFETAEGKNEEIWGLDELEVSKQIEIE
ncbi:hypothetical protein HQ584_07305 [Patescibacteria group bacterium]|nr:hypothetical protein [Patescibacteria group bacterium]